MKTILVIEDEYNQRMLYEEELKEEGYQVLTASDGLSALQVLEKNKPDLITLDIKMPDMDGMEFLRKMCEIGLNIPVIIWTAYDEYKMDFQSWASNAYLVKSSDLSELKKKIKELLG